MAKQTDAVALRAIQGKIRKLNQSYRQFMATMQQLTREQQALLERLQKSIDQKKISTLRQSLGKW